MAKKRQEQKYDHLVKVVIIGDTAVGKTNILLRYVNQQYKMAHITTIGVDFKIKTVNIGGMKLKMQIWDTAGQQRFKTITETYYKGAAGVILVFSVTERKTFNSLTNWIKQINDTQPENIPKVIVGNKCDCSDSDRQVTKQEGMALAQKYGLKFLESSAKDNYNIAEIFSTLGKQIKDKLSGSTLKTPNSNLKINQQNSKKQSGDKKKCC